MLPIQMQVLFLAPLHHLDIAEPLGRGERLDETLRVTNDVEFVLKKIPIAARSELGNLELRAIQRAAAVAYSETTIEAAGLDRIELHLASQLNKLRAFLPMLWIVKDNSVSLENGFLVAAEVVSEMNIGQRAHKADGTVSTCRFSRDELAAAREVYRRIHGGFLVELEKPEDAKGGEIIARGVSPLSRALFFIAAARSTWHGSVRIANYCSALEALLLTESPAELTFRLSQRVAWLLGQSAAERSELFRQMTAIYRIRSTAVHGSTMKRNEVENKLPQAVANADAIVRNVLHIMGNVPVLADYACGTSTDPSAFEDHMHMLCFGTDSDSAGDL